MAIITISRQFGSNGEAIAEVLSEATGYLLLNKKTLSNYISEHYIPEIRLEWIEEKSPQDIEGLEEERLSYIEMLKETITDLARDNDVILLGRGGQFLFQDNKDAVHIRVVAPLENRALTIQNRFDVDKATALGLIKEKDAERSNYTFYFHRGDLNDPEIYDLALNTGKITLTNALELILFFFIQRDIIDASEFEDIKNEAAELMKERSFKRKDIPEKHHAVSDKSKKEFANKSEEEFARILDYYKIRYLYEPTTFPLKWDSEGNVERAFTPDFYFPDFDLYIELTTMKQDLVTKKNRKLREVKKLYPDINIKLFYRKDYWKLLEKFGIDPNLNKKDSYS